MTRITQRLAALSTFTLLGVAPIAHAQTTYFPNDYTISDAVPGAAVVGFANQNDLHNRTNPTSPTVSLINGGSVLYLLAYNSSTVNVSGGSVGGDLYAFDSSTVNVSGGSINGALDASNSSTVNLSGGSGGRSLFAQDSSVLNIFGHNLVAPLMDPNYILFGTSYSRYYLSGTLLDGTVLTNKALVTQNGTGAGFTLTNLDNNAVPEPGSLALLVGGVGVLPLLALRRRRSGN